MSVTIRLAQTGKRNAPAFKIVVSSTRDKRNGRFLDVLGHYNPSHNPVLFEIDKEKYAEWKKKGALSTSAVEGLVEGKYEFAPYTRQNEAKDEEAKVEETTQSSPEAAPDEVNESSETEQAAEEPENQENTDEAANSPEQTE